MSDDKVNATLAAIRRVREEVNAKRRLNRKPLPANADEIIKKHFEALVKKKPSVIKLDESIIKSKVGEKDQD